MSAGAEQVLDGELVEPDESERALGGLVGVEILEGGRVSQQIRGGLTGSERGSPSSNTPEVFRASWTSGSARKARARSFSSRYMAMLALADSHTPS